MPKTRTSPPRNVQSTKWIISKLEEHDKLLQDIFQLLRELKNQQFLIDVLQQCAEEEENDPAS